MIDIDGVISLFGFDQTQPPPGRFLLVDGIPHFLSTTAAALLHDLGKDFEMVWCSGWEERADEHLPAALGLPPGLTHLTFEPGGGDGRHWKLASIDAYAGRHRALAWIDDAFDESCRQWAAVRAAPTRLVATHPAVGLTAGHAQELTTWARSLEGAVASRAGAKPVES